MENIFKSFINKKTKIYSNKFFNEKKKTFNVNQQKIFKQRVIIVIIIKI